MRLSISVTCASLSVATGFASMRSASCAIVGRSNSARSVMPASGKRVVTRFRSCVASSDRTPTTSSLPATKLSGSNPANAASESADIDAEFIALLGSRSSAVIIIDGNPEATPNARIEGETREVRSIAGETTFSDGVNFDGAVDFDGTADFDGAVTFSAAITFDGSAAVTGGGKVITNVELTDTAGKVTVLKEAVAVTEGDVIGASMMSRRALTEFFDREIADAKSKGVLLSLHLKATMMKVSDPIMFGHAVTAYYKDVFNKHAAVFESLGVDPDNGIGDVYKKIQSLPAETRAPSAREPRGSSTTP